MTPDVLTLREAAALARVDRETLRLAITRGELNVRRIGGGTVRAHVRVTREEVLRWVGTACSGSTSAGRAGGPTSPALVASPSVSTPAPRRPKPSPSPRASTGQVVSLRERWGLRPTGR